MFTEKKTHRADCHIVWFFVTWSFSAQLSPRYAILFLVLEYPCSLTENSTNLHESKYLSN